MSNIKDALRGTQGGNSDFPKMNHAIVVELKERNGMAVFTVYNKEMQENIILPSPMKGVLIGVAMRAGAYSDSLGRNGGNYQTAYYLTNKNVVLFAPTSKGYEMVCKGDIEAISTYISREAGSGTNLKKKQVLFTLTENGLYAIITNLSIGIDQYSKNKETLTEKYIILNPKTFDEKDKLISKKAKEYLGKFRSKNPPKYAEITAGEMITEEDWRAWGAQTEVDNHKKWREWASIPTPATPEPAKSQQTNEPMLEKTDDLYETANDEPKDDLPF